jgi:YD repeat-containing protein
MGKLVTQSLPHAPGAAVSWTEHVYDALGRTVEVRQPGGTGTTLTVYEGNTVEVTDPAGKWKKTETDATGNLTRVWEPRPGGGTDYESSYSYSVLGQLLTVTMARPGYKVGDPATVTQTRSWVYDGGTQRLSSVTHPESGTTSYLYNLDGSVQRKTDAKGQYVLFDYDSDGRVTARRRYYAGGAGEDTCGRVDYYYGTQGFAPSFTQFAAGRVAAVATGCAYVGLGQLIEMYSYTAAGAVAKKRLRIVRGTATVDKDVTYGYGSDGKLATVLYPDTTVPLTYTWDAMDRPVGMTGPGTVNNQVEHVKDVTYGVAGQLLGITSVR